MSVRQEAAGILRRITDELRFPSTVASYLRGVTDGLELRPGRRRRSRTSNRPR